MAKFKTLANWGGTPPALAADIVARFHGMENQMGAPNASAAIRHSVKLAAWLIENRSGSYRKICDEMMGVNDEG